MTPPDVRRIEVGIRELHDQLSRYVRHVEAGGEVIVTSRGKRVARLAAIDAPDPLAALRARGLVSEAHADDWEPDPQGSGGGSPVSSLVAEQRR